MAIIQTYERLRALPVYELVRLYDQAAQYTDVGAAFLRDEIARRDAEQQAAAIGRMTRHMRDLTWVITVLTLINAAAAVVLLFRP